jgi:hypothetical protein
MFEKSSKDKQLGASKPKPMDTPRHDTLIVLSCLSNHSLGIKEASILLLKGPVA